MPAEGPALAPADDAGLGRLWRAHPAQKRIQKNLGLYFVREQQYITSPYNLDLRIPRNFLLSLAVWFLSLSTSCFRCVNWASGSSSEGAGGEQGMDTLVTTKSLVLMEMEAAYTVPTSPEKESSQPFAAVMSSGSSTEGAGVSVGTGNKQYVLCTLGHPVPWDALNHV